MFDKLVYMLIAGLQATIRYDLDYNPDPEPLFTEDRVIALLDLIGEAWQGHYGGSFAFDNTWDGVDGSSWTLKVACGGKSAEFQYGGTKHDNLAVWYKEFGEPQWFIFV